MPSHRPIPSQFKPHSKYVQHMEGVHALGFPKNNLTGVIKELNNSNYRTREVAMEALGAIGMVNPNRRHERAADDFQVEFRAGVNRSAVRNLVYEASMHGLKDPFIMVRVNALFNLVHLKDPRTKELFQRIMDKKETALYEDIKIENMEVPISTFETFVRARAEEGLEVLESK